MFISIYIAFVVTVVLLAIIKSLREEEDEL